MPDRRKHRGPHPQDPHLFSDEMVPILRTAVSELSWLLTRGYAVDSALKLVGDRYRLVARQRVAVRRAASSDQALTARKVRETALDFVADMLVVDGFNLIVTVEAALSGGVLLTCRDGAIRDLASVHGSYRKVDETIKAVELIASLLDKESPTQVKWLLDSPVSNSGRLATVLREYGENHGMPWEVELRKDVDSQLVRSRHPVVTSDSNVLDGEVHWVNLAERVIALPGIEPWIVDLRG